LTAVLALLLNATATMFKVCELVPAAASPALLREASAGRERRLHRLTSSFAAVSIADTDLGRSIRRILE